MLQLRILILLNGQLTRCLCSHVFDPGDFCHEIGHNLIVEGREDEGVFCLGLLVVDGAECLPELANAHIEAGDVVIEVPAEVEDVVLHIELA